MKIAVIGAGRVGTALGENWRDKGHEVAYGVTDPAEQKNAGLGAGRALAVRDAASWAEVLVLATPWQAAESVCQAMGDVAGKIIIDCMNPLAMGPRGLALSVGFSTSGAEQVQAWCPGASVFKSLNQTGFETMAAPGRMREKPIMLVAGDDANHKPTVLQLINDLGFEAIDSGPLVNARLLEPYAMVWIDLAFNRGMGRDFAFAITRASAT